MLALIRDFVGVAFGFVALCVVFGFFELILQPDPGAATVAFGLVGVTTP
ncbi:hypothetical protein [Roseospira marina]|nr:hypothetical protein [Roseospira marina]MBB4313040.1 hypothetical protein [Roseospira marina]MBB5089303.1 hypothetical protein [Roseospira marina]